MTNDTTYSLIADGVGPVEVTVSDTGTGHAYLLLHGGAGRSRLHRSRPFLPAAAHGRSRRRIRGDSDRIVDSDYGRAYASAIPGRPSSCSRIPGTCRSWRLPNSC